MSCFLHKLDNRRRLPPPRTAVTATIKAVEAVPRETPKGPSQLEGTDKVTREEGTVKPADEHAVAYAVRAAVEPARGSVLVANFAIKSVNMHCSQEVIAVTVLDAQRQESLAAHVVI